MAVVQMKYVSVMGPLKLFDEFILTHVINRNIQVEYSCKAMNIQGLIPFEEDTETGTLHKRMHILNDRIKAGVRIYDKDTVVSWIMDNYNFEEARSYVESIEKRFDESREAIASLKTEIQEREQIIKQITPISELKVNIDEMFRFNFMKFRFGSMPKENFTKQKPYLDELDVLYVPVSEEDENIWLSYFMPAQVGPVIDNVFSALGFERVRISDQVYGLPKEAIERMTAEIEQLKRRIEDEENAIKRFIEEERERFEILYNKVLYRSKMNEIRMLSAHFGETFLLVGWLPREDYELLSKELEAMDQYVLSSEDPDCVMTSTPPTVMKNSKIFKPFEFLVSLFGLPSAKEVDPTKLLAITYVLMFGFMFGDVGQGLIIAAVGLYLYFARKMQAAGILIYVGISSTFFGFMYGSVFGNEEIIGHIMISPLHDKNSINNILVISAVYGVFVILSTIVANIINSARMRNWGRLIFDRNGIAGLLFYGGVIVCTVISVLTGKIFITAAVIIIVVVIPALLLVFREPLENLIRKKDHIMPHNKGMYFVEAGFELFETVLNFFSGTLSFLRVGAFALNHAGLSLAVWSLYSMMSGVGGILVVIIGNALTIVLEGLIVGIQCLRLEYYEMFGRFYLGEGREFKPVSVKDD
jgi:V/A-type H+-transporting ATPase subunit I